MFFKVLLFSASLAVVFQFSSGAFNLKQCYSCEYFEYHGENATNIKKCEENPPPKELMMDCSKTEAGKDATEWQCVKVTGRIEIDEENYNYIRRDCIPGKNFDTCKDCKDSKSYQTKYGFVKRGKHCVCDDEDNCNSGNGLAVSLMTVVVGLYFASVKSF